MDKRSWITPAFLHIETRGLVGCLVSKNSVGLIEFLATGQLALSPELRPAGLRQYAKALNALGSELYAVVLEAVASGALVEPAIGPAAIVVYLCGVYWLPDTKKVC